MLPNWFIWKPSCFCVFAVMKKKLPVPWPVPPLVKKSGSNSCVMYDFVLSHVPRMLQLKLRRFRTGRFTAASHVWLSSVPAFCHCVEKPRVAAVGTGRIWLFVVVRACVSSMPSRSNSVKSLPSSISRVVSGLRFGLPAWPRLHPLAPQLYVSYCAVNCGELPAVPSDARRRKSERCGILNHGSSDTRHTPDTRPNGAQRLPATKSELPS